MRAFKTGLEHGAVIIASMNNEAHPQIVIRGGKEPRVIKDSPEARRHLVRELRITARQIENSLKEV